MAHPLLNPTLFRPARFVQSNYSPPIGPVAFAQVVLIEGHNQAGRYTAVAPIFV